MNKHLTMPKKEIIAFCKKWDITELALFGSALRDDFNSESDIDFLVTFTPEADWGLLDHVKMEMELENIIGRKVDLVTKRSIERSQNPIRKKAILESAKVFYAA